MRPETGLRVASGLGLGLVIVVLFVGWLFVPADDDTDTSGENADAALPEGHLRRLRFTRDGRTLNLGPFVGYSFAPIDGDHTHVRFQSRNVDQHYTTDLPAGALLYTGEARLRELPQTDTAFPQGDARITPMSFDAAPAAWLDTRPLPQHVYRHFHSCYTDDRQATRVGYWLRHEAVASFTYDMGGRVGPGSVLFHHVTPGTDTHFAELLEFDRGPAPDDGPEAGLEQ